MANPIGENRPEIEASDIPLDGFLKIFKNNMISQTVHVKSAKDDVFVFEYQGHDPYDHHGRFMHPIIAGYVIKYKDLIIIDEASDWPLNDPYNYTGKQIREAQAAA